MRTFLTEIKKTKGRKIWLLLPAAFLLIFVWIYWNTTKMKEPELAKGYYGMLLDFPLVNTVILPPVIAVLASRLCDIENKGNTYKLLCTMENKGGIFGCKLLLGGLYLLAFVILELCGMLFLGLRFAVPQSVPWDQITYWFIATFLTSLTLFLLQEILSLMMDNQLYPLFIGIIGGFIGLFSWFFPNLPLRWLVPWGYYCVGTTIYYNWDKNTRILDYYTVPFAAGWFVVLVLAGALLYVLGRQLFIKKEV